MTIYTWSDALRARLHKRLRELYTDRVKNSGWLPNPIALQDYLDALISEGVSTTYWRSGSDSVMAFCRWLDENKGQAIAASLIRDMAHEWEKATEVAEAMTAALWKLTQWTAPGIGRTCIDPEAIESSESI